MLTWDSLEGCMNVDSLLFEYWGGNLGYILLKFSIGNVYMKFCTIFPTLSNFVTMVYYKFILGM